MRLEEFTNGEYYHVFNRGVDKQNIYKDRMDYIFLLNSLHRFNTSNSQKTSKKESEPLVSIISYTATSNHFHIQLRQELTNGISRFLHKVEMSYARYFNKKYNRKGRLFESTFQARHLNSDSYLEHIPRYIHLNILDLTEHDWRSGKIFNWSNALEFMNQYPWSSHKAYMTRDEAVPILNMDIINDMFPTKDDYTEFLRQWSQAEASLSDLLVTT